MTTSTDSWFITGAGRGTGRIRPNGRQAGDPAKLARAQITIAAQDQPPLRWVAGADAVAAAEQKAHDLIAEVDAHRELSTNLAHDHVPAVA